MKTRIKSAELVRYLSMGWKISQLAFNDTECWMVMDGSLRQKILDDLGLLESNVVGSKWIPGAKITHRMLCCWYAVERYGMSLSDVAAAFDIDHTTVNYGHEKVNTHVRFNGVDEDGRPIIPLM